MEVILGDLTKHFGKVAAVENLNLKMKHGEFIALLGPSGCGKTTTLLMIAGIYRPSGGYIKFDDRVVNHLLPKDRNIGMVFQSYALYPHMTVYENISFPLKLQRVPEKEKRQRAQKVIDMMQLGHLMARKPAQLSGGQQQRVALCRALVKEPDILLFDEPLSNLDATLRLRMRAEIKRLQMDLGITAIFVTHDQVEAMTMADRIAVMQGGALEAYATSDQLYKRPETLFVAEFIGSPPMNFLDVTLEERNTGFFLMGQGLELKIPDEKGHLARRNGAGREVTMGIRPEDIATGEDDQLRAQVYLIETLGREDLVNLQLEEQQLRILTHAPFQGQVGEAISLNFNMDKVHLFSQETGRSLLIETQRLAVDSDKSATGRPK
jgi:inositol-phosphate transport system ATP-binding protein